jgi:hypothetical protein
MALEQMDGFELAGRTVKKNHLAVDISLICVVPSVSSVSILSTRREPQSTLPRILWMKRAVNKRFLQCHLDTNFLLGGNLNAASRQALMQKLARIEPTSKLEPV